jgi:hypothetical protein
MVWWNAVARDNKHDINYGNNRINTRNRKVARW